MHAQNVMPRTSIRRSASLTFDKLPVSRPGIGFHDSIEHILEVCVAATAHSLAGELRKILSLGEIRVPIWLIGAA